MDGGRYRRRRGRHGDGQLHVPSEQVSVVAAAGNEGQGGGAKRGQKRKRGAAHSQLSMSTSAQPAEKAARATDPPSLLGSISPIRAEQGRWRGPRDQMPMEHSSADGAAPEARAEGREEQFAGQVPVSGADAASQTFPEGGMDGDEVD